MPIFAYESLLAAPVQRVWDFHMQDGALQKLSPPGDDVRVVTPARVEEGSVVELSIRLAPLPFRVRWRSQHRDIRAPHQFVDVALQSPFARWEHRHLFGERGAHTLMRDEVHWEAPLGPLGNFFSRPMVEAMLRAQFVFRHQVLRREFGQA